jgi:hypothetical protein
VQRGIRGGGGGCRRHGCVDEDQDQAYLDAAGAKVKEERVTATREDGGDADGLHLSTNGMRRNQDTRYYISIP